MANVEDPRRRRFPADIEAEILLRLPVKTLIRFKIACKQWSSPISSSLVNSKISSTVTPNTTLPLLFTLHSKENLDIEPDPGDDTLRYYNYSSPEAGVLFRITNFSKYFISQFYNLYFSTFNTNPLALVNSFSKTFPEPLFDNSAGGKPFMQSCKGLVCIASWSWTVPPILICNPATRDLIILPPTKEYNVRVGFGYAPSTQQFKVARFFHEENKMKSRCQVFTLGTTHWRKAKSLTYRTCDGTAPFLHGAVHCLPQTSPRGVRETDIIVAFDLDTEQYTKHIPLPAFYYSLGNHGKTFKNHGIVDVKSFMRLTILGGSLCLTVDYGELKCYLELWLLKDYNNAQWVKGYTINVSTVYPYRSFSFWAYPADNMVDESILLNCSSEQGVKLLDYNPQNGSLTVKKPKEWAATFYQETLYPVRS